MKKSKITIDVSLDDNFVPEEIEWTAKDGGVENQKTKAALLSFWDDDKKEAMRLDLWTKDLTMDEMKIFFHQIFVSMAQTYERATSESNVAKMIAQFAEEYAMASKIK